MTMYACRILQHAHALRAKIFSPDEQADACELQQTHRAVAHEHRQWRALVSGAVESTGKLDAKLAQQIRAIMVITAEWKDMKALVSKAAETLEQCRLERVQAEQDHADHFQFGDMGCGGFSNNVVRVDIAFADDLTNVPGSAYR